MSIKIEKYMIVCILLICKLFSINASNTGKNQLVLQNKTDQEVKNLKRKLPIESYSTTETFSSNENPNLHFAKQNKMAMEESALIDLPNKLTFGEAFSDQKNNKTIKKAPNPIITDLQSVKLYAYISKLTDEDLINKIREISVKFRDEIPKYNFIKKFFRYNNNAKRFKQVKNRYFILQEIKNKYSADFRNIMDDKSTVIDIQKFGTMLVDLLLLPKPKYLPGEVSRFQDIGLSTINFPETNRKLEEIYQKLQDTYNIISDIICANTMEYSVEKQNEEHMDQFKTIVPIVQCHLVAKDFLDILFTAEINKNGFLDFKAFTRYKNLLINSTFEIINKIQFQFQICQIQLPRDDLSIYDKNFNKEIKIILPLKKRKEYEKTMFSFLKNTMDMNFWFEKNFIISFLLKLTENNNLFYYLRKLSSTLTSDLEFYHSLFSNSSKLGEVLSPHKDYQQILNVQAHVSKIFSLLINLCLKIIELNDEITNKQSFLKIKNK